MKMDSFVGNLRFGVRSLRRHARLAALAAITLALGIGASTTILTVTKQVLLDPLPYPESDRLVIVWSELPKASYTRAPISGPELHDLRTRLRHFEEFASVWTTSGALVADDEPEAVQLGLVTWNFPSIFGVDPIVGRSFEPADEGTMSDSVLISEALWRRRFGGEQSVLGRSVRVDGGWGFPGGTFTVVGVLPASFQLVLPSDAGVSTDLDLWVPFARDLKEGSRGLGYLRTVGRVRLDSTFQDARHEIRALGPQLESEFPDYDANGRGFDVVPLKGDAVGAARPAILALLAGTGILLLIACGNVANLLLSRFAERWKEIRVRTALGASRGQIAAQLLTESLLLATAGGLGGIALGILALRPLLALAPSNLPRPEEIVPDPMILGVAFALSLLCGLLFGLAPVLALRDRALSAGLRSATPGGGGGGFAHRGRSALVVAELALALVLSVGAALCFRTVVALQDVELGYDADGVLTMELTLPYQRYGSGTELNNFVVEVERRMETIGGVVRAGAINQLPLSDLPNWSSPYSLRSADSDAELGEADGRVVSPGYLQAVGAKLIEGRLIESRDDASQRHVVVVDELLASRAWPGASAVGEEVRIRVATEEGFAPVWAEVIGVIEHMRHHDPRFELREQLFVPFAQGARNQMALAIRASGSALELLPRVRQELHAVDKDLAVSNVRLLEDYTRDARSVQWFTMVLAAGFAAMAIVLGSLGIYGVISHAVSARQREIGLRLALGSTAGGIARWVVKQSVTVVASGIGLGFLAALAAGRMLEGLLYGVESSDPVTLAVVPIVLTGVAILASFVPARRATRVDPITALRQD